MMPTLYDLRILRAIRRSVMASGEDYIVYHSPFCTPPQFVDEDRITVRAHPLVPVGRLLSTARGADIAGGMRLVRSVTFGDEAATIEYVDPGLGAGHLTSAVVVPYDEDHADELDSIQAHAGLIAGGVLATMEGH